MISGLVLAAGTSSRLGRPKQLLDLGGKPVIRHVVEAALAAPLDDVLVVLGHRAAEIAAALPGDERVHHVANERFAEGMSTSLAAGLERLQQSDDCEAAVVLLGDQPSVRAEAIEAVVQAFRNGHGPVVQAAYGGVSAHPTLFARSAWSDLQPALHGDMGAGHFLALHPEVVWPVELGGTAPLDIDTEDDYRRVRAQFDSGHWSD